MVIKVFDGIKIKVDDEKLVSWECSKGGSLISLSMKDGNGIRNFEFDASERNFKEVK